MSRANPVRGELLWTAWVSVAVRLVSDMLVLLGAKRDVYLAIDERKVGRVRWVDGVGGCRRRTQPTIDYSMPPVFGVSGTQKRGASGGSFGEPGVGVVFKGF